MIPVTCTIDISSYAYSYMIFFCSERERRRHHATRHAFLQTPRYFFVFKQGHTHGK